MRNILLFINMNMFRNDIGLSIEHNRDITKKTL